MSQIAFANSHTGGSLRSLLGQQCHLVATSWDSSTITCRVPGQQRYLVAISQKLFPPLPPLSPQGKCRHPLSLEAFLNAVLGAKSLPVTQASHHLSSLPCFQQAGPEAWCGYLGIKKLLIKHGGLGARSGFHTLGTVDILGLLLLYCGGLSCML